MNAAAHAARRPLRMAQWNSAAGANTSSGETSMSAAATPYPATLRAIRANGRSVSGMSLCGRDDSNIVRLVGGEGQQGCRARAFDGVLELALVKCAGAGDAARKDLAALRDELLQHLHVLVVDVLEFLDAELADALAAVEELLLSARAGVSAAALAALARSAGWCAGCHVSRSPDQACGAASVDGSGATDGSTVGTDAAIGGAGRTRSFFGFFLASLSARLRSRSVRTIMCRMTLSEFFMRRSTSASEASLSNTKRW